MKAAVIPIEEVGSVFTGKRRQIDIHTALALKWPAAPKARYDLFDAWHYVAMRYAQQNGVGFVPGRGEDRHALEERHITPPISILQISRVAIHEVIKNEICTVAAWAYRLKGWWEASPRRHSHHQDPHYQARLPGQSTGG